MSRQKRRKPRVVLSDAQIEELLDEMIKGIPAKVLADRFDVAHATVTSIRRQRLEVILRRREFQKSFKF